MALAAVTGYKELVGGRRPGLHAAPIQSGVLSSCPFGTDFDLSSGFSLPFPSSVEHPKSFVESHFGAKSAVAGMKFYTGTTTLAFAYEGESETDEGGIIVAVDSRASAGEYIASKTVMKILDISDSMVATMAGGAADCEFWIRTLARQCALFELQNNEPMSVAAASKLFSNILYNYKGMGISIGSIIAGYDKRGPSLYYVDSEATRLKGNLFSVGSGMMNAMSVLDSFYQPKMSDAEAKDLGVKAIMHATFRDAGSGGCCNVAHITPKLNKIKDYGKDVSEMYYQFMEEIGRETYEPSLQ